MPLGVFASGRRAPSRHRDERVHTHDDESLIANLKRMSGTNSQVFADDEILRMILPAVRSDYKAAETYRYRPGPPLTLPGDGPDRRRRLRGDRRGGGGLARPHQRRDGDAHLSRRALLPGAAQGRLLEVMREALAEVKVG